MRFRDLELQIHGETARSSALRPAGAYEAPDPRREGAGGRGAEYRSLADGRTGWFIAAILYQTVREAASVMKKREKKNLLRK